MAEIKGFRGLLYNKEKLGDLDLVMAPPYDVISPERQEKLYERHPKNVVRLDFGKTGPDDTEGNDRYTRAAETLAGWMEAGVLVRDEKPAIYYYTQTYTASPGTRLTRKGFIALSKLEEFSRAEGASGGGIRPHERTLSGPKADRLRLMQATAANFSCIFSLYSEKELTVNILLDAATKGTAPLVYVVDDESVENRLWRVDDPEVIERVAAALKDRPLFIADGHHRYETALNYCRLMKEKNPGHTGDEPYNYVMMYFSNMDDEGMTVWPTHRVIHSLDGFEADGFISECEKYFEIKEFKFNSNTYSEVQEAFLADLRATGGNGRAMTALGLRIVGRDAYHVLRLRSEEIMDEVLGVSLPEVFKELDVTVLHSLVLDRILGITAADQESQKNIVYVKSLPEAFTAASDKGAQMVFFLNPTPVAQVRAVAEAGAVMPQKSTYFYPKLLTGMVFNLLSDDAADGAPARV